MTRRRRTGRGRRRLLGGVDESAKRLPFPRGTGCNGPPWVLGRRAKYARSVGVPCPTSPLSGAFELCLSLRSSIPRAATARGSNEACVYARCAFSACGGTHTRGIDDVISVSETDARGRVLVGCSGAREISPFLLGLIGAYRTGRVNGRGLLHLLELAFIEPSFFSRSAERVQFQYSASEGDLERGRTEITSRGFFSGGS